MLMHIKYTSPDGHRIREIWSLHHDQCLKLEVWDGYRWVDPWDLMVVPLKLPRSLPEWSTEWSYVPVEESEP